MTKEEQNIKQKIESLSDLDFFMDDTDLWHRLEQKLDKKSARKPKILWLWSAAASLLIGVFLFADFKKKDVPKMGVLAKESSEVVAKSTQNPTPCPSPIGRGVTKFSTPLPIFGEGQGVGLGADNQVVTQEKQLNTELKNLHSKTNFDTLVYHRRAIVFEPKFKIEQVTVIDFPVIPDAMMKREVFAKRLFRQIKSFNTEGKIDWRELNIEPRNVWAYLERNFKYDTTSIQNKKQTKL